MALRMLGPHVPLVGHLDRADLGALAAAGAAGLVDVAGLLADLDLEVADEAADLLHLAVGRAARCWGSWPTDTILGVPMQAAQSRVGKVLSYWSMCPPTVGCRLHQVGLEAGLGDIEGGLHAGDAARPRSGCWC